MACLTPWTILGLLWLLAWVLLFYLVLYQRLLL
jgi:hypothetical protein